MIGRNRRKRRASAPQGRSTYRTYAARWLTAVLILLAFGCVTASTPSATKAELPNDSEVAIGPFTDVEPERQQELIQSLLDSASDTPAVFRFRPGEYRLSDPRGLRVPANATLILTGARFFLAKEMSEDGQAFLLDNVSDVTFRDGEIIGQRDAWEAGTNIAGVRAVGPVRNLRITGTRFGDLSSNAVGVFAPDEANPARNILIQDVQIENCCNVYVDYLNPNKGPAPGSVREDQGGIAFYYVADWRVEGCRLNGSQSDGTHFFHSRAGVFANNTVAESRMGGYFLEGCREVIASGNLVRNNGSRGVTIERDSVDCILQNNVITGSGREGLWAPDVEGIVIAGNVFRENGRKDDGEKDCEIRLDETPEFATSTSAVRVEGNVFFTSEHQTAVAFVDEGVEAAIGANTYHGPAPVLRTPGDTAEAAAN